MRYALPDIHRLYRNLHPADHSHALRVSHALGEVWYAGRDRVLAPQPAAISAPWCQLGVVPFVRTDGIEDRLIVCDAQLAAHQLAWRVDAPANEGNVFLRAARDLELVNRVDAVLPDCTVLIGGVLVEPFGEARFVARTVTVEGQLLSNTAAAAVLASLGLDSS